MKKKMLLAFLLGLIACGRGGDSPVTPDPVPTAVPTPEPTRPAWPFGVVFCCNNNPGWPLATDEQLAQAAEAGATMTHFRTGPFEDGSEDAAATTIPLLVHAVQTANSLGITPEVDLVDNWALVNRVNRWHDSCAVTQAAPPQRYIDHVREVVGAMAGSRVTYQLGNEGYRCTPSRAWSHGLLDAAHAAGATRVGTNAGDGIGDYITIHGFNPTSNGVVLNETDNRDYTAEQWVWLYRESRARGGYIMVWFGPSSDERRVEILNAMKHVDDTAVAQCIVPPSEDPGWAPPSSPQGAEMKGTVAAAVGLVPATCGQPDFSTGFSQIEKVVAELLDRGQCADRSRDALFIRNSKGKFEEYHIFSYATGCWATDPHKLPAYIWTWQG